MVNEKHRLMRVEVLYAQPDLIWRRCVDLPEGATVGEALKASDLLRHFPEFGGMLPAVGVFGRVCPLEHVLQPDDRVEVYRSLVFDPMESRRRRIHHRKRKGVEGSS